jgi:lysine 2,3-aminomutase
MLQKISNHLENLLPREEAIRRQFEISEEEIENELTGNYDPLLEKHYEAAPGLIHKYGNRVLCLLTSECAAYCRFCTRKRLVSDIELGKVSAEIIDVWVNYLNNHREVSEVIVSGGDPFTVDDELFDYALSSLAGVCSVNVLRVGTRVPVSEPSLVTPKKLDTIRRITKPVYIGIHFEHPSEITCPTICCAKRLRQAGAILYSQSVFLKGVNDDFDTLSRSW